jgi:hypothetical protein
LCGRDPGIGRNQALAAGDDESSRDREVVRRTRPHRLTFHGNTAH